MFEREWPVPCVLVGQDCIQAMQFHYTPSWKPIYNFFFIIDSYKPYCSWKLSSIGWVYAGSFYQYSPAWRKEKKIMKRRFWLNEHTLELDKLHTDWISKITYCFLSRSFSKASKRRPRPSWPKLLTQLENTEKPKNQWSNIPAKLLLSCWFIESHRH